MGLGDRTTALTGHGPHGGAKKGSETFGPEEGAWAGSALEPLLRRAFEAGSREYGPLPLTLEVFARRALELARARLLRSGLPCPPERIAELLERAAVADLYLSIACEEGLERGWEAFTARFLPRVKALALWHGASPSEAEDLALDLPGHLAAPPRGGAPRTRLGTYNGAVSLFDWLAVIVVQRLTDRWRTLRRAPREAAGAEVEAARVDGDPAEHLLDVETAGWLEEALGEAWKRLAPREAAALRLKFKEGLPQKQIAILFGVGEPQVSKILKAGVEKIRSEVDRRLREDLPGRWTDRDGLWSALRDAIGEHLERTGTSTG